MSGAWLVITILLVLILALLAAALARAADAGDRRENLTAPLYLHGAVDYRWTSTAEPGWLDDDVDWMWPL